MMNYWHEIIKTLLDGITITIRVERSKADNAQPMEPINVVEEERHMVTCEYCGWNNTYASADSAARALRSHHNHCPKYGEDSTSSDHSTWINAMHESDEPRESQES